MLADLFIRLLMAFNSIHNPDMISALTHIMFYPRGPTQPAKDVFIIIQCSKHIWASQSISVYCKIG